MLKHNLHLNSKAINYLYSNMEDFNAANNNYINLFVTNESLNTDDLHYKID